MNKIRRYLKLPFRIKIMVFEAFFYSGKYRFLLLHRSFGRFAEKLGTKENKQRQQIYTPRQLDCVNEIAKAVDMVCNHTPWKSECLVRAFAAQRMLMHRGIAGTVFMGVANDEKGKMIAHAWTRCGERFVTGRGGYERYAVTGIFNTILPVHRNK